MRQEEDYGNYFDGDDLLKGAFLPIPRQQVNAVKRLCSTQPDGDELLDYLLPASPQ